jgi:hypothetical protein
MSNQRIIGIALLVAGAILFIMGMNASDSLADRWSNFFTGHFTDTTVWYLVGGAASAAVGFIMMSGRRVL